MSAFATVSDSEPSVAITGIVPNLSGEKRNGSQSRITNFFNQISDEEHEQLLALQSIREAEKMKEIRITMPLHANVAETLNKKRKFNLQNGTIIDAHAYIDYIMKNPNHEDGLEVIKLFHFTLFFYFIYLLLLFRIA
jgi:hypothetical protein